MPGADGDLPIANAMAARHVDDEVVLALLAACPEACARPVQNQETLLLPLVWQAASLTQPRSRRAKAPQVQPADAQPLKCLLNQHLLNRRKPSA
jgi:hypothetical protein